MNFNEIASFQESANEGRIKAVEIMEVRV
jgi:hypothetical protein